MLSLIYKTNYSQIVSKPIQPVPILLEVFRIVAFYFN